MSAKKALASIALGVDSKGMPKQLAAARGQLKAFGADAKKDLSKAFKSAKGLLGGAGGLLGKAGGLVGAGFGIQAAGGITDMLGDMLTFEKSLTRFQITAGKSTIETWKMREAILGVSKATGIGQNEILAGAQTYVDLTGDVAGAEAAMSSFARIAQASGSSVGDIATATAALQQSMKLDPADIEKVFSGLITQGKMGAVSLKDFAGELSALAPKFAKFGGGTGNGAILNLGAAFQVARQGFGSASEAATGLEAITGALALNAAKFKASGVEIYKTGKNGKKEFRSFAEIIDAIGRSKLAKDPTLLAKALGSKEALQAYDMLARNKDMLEQLAVAGQDAGAVQRDLATYQESAAGKIEAAWNNVKVTLAEAFTPERIKAFADALVMAADILAKIVGYVEQAVEFVDDMRGDDTKKVARKSNENSAKWIAEAKDMPAAQKEALGRQYLQAYANEAQKDTPSGSKGTRKETYQESMRKAGQALLDQAQVEGDLWGMGGAKATVPQSTLEDPTARKLENELMGRDIKDALVQALVEGLAKNPIVVKLDSTTAQQKLNNAPMHRNGHGGGR